MCLRLVWRPTPKPPGSPSRCGDRLPVWLCVQMVQGLCAMHDRYILHRDVKPGNMLVLKGGDVRIIDFDCSKRLTPETCNDGASWYAGTERYMAPEVKAPRDGRRYGLPADVYSCGIVLREFAGHLSSGSREVRRGVRLPHVVVALVGVGLSRHDVCVLGGGSGDCRARRCGASS